MDLGIKMLLFNYSAIYLISRGDSRLIVKYLQAMHKGRYKMLKGLNFIINPEVLYLETVSFQHRAEYIGICSLRRLSDYKTKNEVNLHISRVPPWVPSSAVKENPLLEIKQPILKLKLEE